MEKTEVSRGELVVAREDPPVVLDLVDEALHQVALFVQMSIVLPRLLPVGPGRDDGDRATLADYLDEGLGVVPLCRQSHTRRGQKGAAPQPG